MRSSDAAHEADPTRLRLWPSIAAGLVAALVVLGMGGSAAILNRPEPAWQVDVTLLVRPTSSSSESSTAGYYENLSSGQVVQTYAEVLRSRSFRGVAQADGRSLARVTVVPDTFLLRLQVPAPTEGSAVALGRDVGRQAVAAIASLEQPYTVRVVGMPEDNVQQTGGLDLSLLGVVGLCALLYGIAVQQVVALVQRRRLRIAELRGDVDEDGDDSDDSDDSVADGPVVAALGASAAPARPRALLGRR